LSQLSSFPIPNPPLDSQLLSLSTRESQGTEMPLAIRRFISEYGEQRPTLAMKLATDRLLSSYFDSPDSSKLPISVERLCSLCGVELVGNRPSGRPRSGYSIIEHRIRTGHTGRLAIRDLRLIIRIPDEIDFETARISTAHEIGHVLIHRRGAQYDPATMRLPTTAEEEALAEYAARLLLLPAAFFQPLSERNLAEFAVEKAGIFKVSVHSAVSRLGDPDIPNTGIKGAIFWRINQDLPGSSPLHKRLTPQWHLCPGAFVPVRRCKARIGSLVAELADWPSPKAGSDIQSVNIGTFSGTFRVDVFAWGSVAEGTRSVLSLFREL
jgi:uncharacterized protein DUF955